MTFLIGVDVSTRSFQAGIFDKTSATLTTSSHPSHLTRPKVGLAQLSSTDIWSTVYKGCTLRLGLALQGARNCRISRSKVPCFPQDIG